MDNLIKPIFLKSGYYICNDFSLKPKILVKIEFQLLKGKLIQ